MVKPLSSFLEGVKGVKGVKTTVYLDKMQDISPLPLEIDVTHKTFVLTPLTP